MDPNNPETLISFPSDVRAAAFVTALRARGIEATTTGGYTSGFRAEAPGQVNVIVRQADLVKARAALDQIKQDVAEIDWSQVDVGRPES